MLTLFLIGVIMALLALVILAVAILGAAIVLLGKLAGVAIAVGFFAFGAWVILKAAKAIYDKVMK